MKLPVQLSDHARTRLQERTSLSEPAFVALLERHQTVSVGYRRSSGHWHRLFFSEPDRKHFVAIQDISDGGIVTILPLDYHENLAWKIDEDQKRSAIWKAAPDVHADIYLSKPAPSPGSKMEITGVFAPKGKRIHLGTHRFAAAPSTAAQALADDVFVAKLFEKMKQRGLEVQALEVILLYHKGSSAFMKLSWDSIEEFSLEFDRPKLPS